MSDAEKTIKLSDAEFAGAVIGAQIAQGQALTNAIEDNLREEVLEWQRAFLALYQGVDTAAEVVTTRELETLLSRYEWNADRAVRAVRGEQA